MFSTGEAMEPQFINNFAAAAFCTFKDFGTSSEGDCNTELTRTDQVSNTGFLCFGFMYFEDSDSWKKLHIACTIISFSRLSSEASFQPSMP